MSAELIDIAPSSRVGANSSYPRASRWSSPRKSSTITVFSGGPPLPTAGRWETIFLRLRGDGVRNVSLITGATHLRGDVCTACPEAAAKNGIRITGAASLSASDDLSEIARQIVKEEPDIVVAAVYPKRRSGL
jgi:hypothetical protein